MKLSADEKHALRHAFVFPFLLTLVIWVIHIIKVYSGISFDTWGIYPQTIYGLKGIIFAPLLHNDFSHIFNNTIPLLILTTTIFYFYRPIAFKVTLLLWLVTGLCVWIGGRDAYHIGASGLIYGEAAFLFFSGVFRRNIKLASISLLVIFLYGGMVWGVFPVFREISWESHLFGGITGLTFAVIFKDEGPENEREITDDDEDEDDDDKYYMIDEEIDNEEPLNHT